MSELVVNLTEDVLNVEITEQLTATLTEDVLSAEVTTDGLVVTITDDVLSVTFEGDLTATISEDVTAVSLGEVVEITNNYGSAYYEHLQSVASTTWTINHNLGKNPSVTVIDSGGSYIVTDIAYTNSNTLVLTFSAALGGTAYLN